jgi:zinc protease
MLTALLVNGSAALATEKTVTAQEDNRKKTFGIQHGALSNGMEVYVIPNHRVPVVTHMVWYKVGAADEAWGKSGIAHFMEHLMFKGSENVPSGEFSKIVKKLGGRDNAFTSQDYTAYHQSIARQHLEGVMAMEADRMKGMILTKEDIIAERNVVIEERRQRTENKPQAHFQERVRASLFVNHPYGIPVIGWMHEIEKLNGRDAHRFHKRYYRPDNAILVVSGDITLDELVPLAEKTYGQIKPEGKSPVRRWTKVPAIPGQSSFTLYDDTIRQARFSRQYRVPSSGQDKQTALALQILENVLDGGSATRFYQSLVKDQKVAIGTSIHYSSSQVSDATLWIGGTPSVGTEMNTLENAIDAEIAKLLADGITEQELAEAKLRLQDQAIFARDSLTGPAMIVGRMITTGSDINDIEYWPHDIGAITIEDVNAAAKAVFTSASYVTAYAFPKEKQVEQPSLEEKPQPPKDIEKDTASDKEQE